MAAVEFRVNEPKPGVKVVEFKLPGPITPEHLEEIVARAPEVEGAELLVLSGRGPIWLYAALLHKYLHTNIAVATYDPKLRGAVVVASHTPEYRVGQVVPLA